VAPTPYVPYRLASLISVKKLCAVRRLGLAKAEDLVAETDEVAAETFLVAWRRQSTSSVTRSDAANA
jgi:hypothetical protein